MQTVFRKIALFGALLLAAASVSLLPSFAPPKADATREEAGVTLQYKAEYTVVVQENEGGYGTYRVPYGCTYGELFALASVEPPAWCDLDAPVSFADAVMVGGEYYIYLVL